MRPLTDGPLADLRARPLADPVGKAYQRRLGYRKHPVDLTHPRARDPLVEVTEAGISGQNAYHAETRAPYHGRIDGSVPDLLLRAPLVARLAGVNERLSDYGLELWVFDAWRPIAVQNYFHDVWMPAKLRDMHPDWTAAQIATETSKYWAKGADGQIDPKSPPPHATGAAVDLTIRYRSGPDLFMGTIFDDVSAASQTDHFEDLPPGLAFSAQEAQANRRLLYWLMEEAGFANNPTEWWHFSLGDQMWARLTGQKTAFYS
ncbi:MAG: M15 family metallopeptidase, partial [Pseudomonadota bacterium]